MRKDPRKKAKKATVEVQPAVPPARIVQPNNYPSGCDEENLLDYDEIEGPATFSPAEEDNYSDGDGYPAHRDRPEDINENTDEFPAYSAEAVDNSVGGKRSQILFRRGSVAASPRGASAMKALNKQIITKQLIMIA